MPLEDIHSGNRAADPKIFAAEKRQSPKRSYIINAMKRLSDQNYYEILEISYRATWGEIQKAYELARKTYGPDSIASYSLFDADDREVIFKKIEEAYQTLIDQEKRRRYDEDLAKIVQELAGQVPSTLAEPVTPLGPEGSLTDQVT